MKEQKFTVSKNDVAYGCVIDERGMVWFNDEKGMRTNIGQVAPVWDIETAQKLVQRMLEGSGR